MKNIYRYERSERNKGWLVRLRVKGVTYCKVFTDNEHGKEKAFKEAVNYRKQCLN